MEKDGPTALPPGVLAAGRNISFHGASVRTRWGIQRQFQTPGQSNAITGLASGTNQQPGGNTQVPIVYDMGGQLLIESPAGSGTLVPVTASPLVTQPANAHAQFATAFNRAYMAFSDLRFPIDFAAVYDLPTGNLDPYTMKPFGVRWSANTKYFVGEVVTPTVGTIGNGHTYRCTVAGTSAALATSEPVWPLGDGATIADNTCTWQEQTAHAGTVIDGIPNTFFTCSTSAGAGTFAAARDIYIAVTISNASGESMLSAPLKAITNSVLNDRVVVVIAAAFPSWLTGLIAPFVPTSASIYAADVATGAVAPASTAYHKIAGALALSSSTNVNATGAGAAPPTTNGALIAASNSGNICTGTRFMTIMFKNRNASISGMTEASVITISIPTPGGQKMWAGNIPIGPSGMVASRVLAFTDPTGTTVGEYFYIGTADTVSGIAQSATVIDNAVGGLYLNFTDIYLNKRTKTTSSFRKIQCPPCVDIYYSETLNRLIITGATGFSGQHLISLPGDPEGIYGDTGAMSVGQLNGDILQCWRDFQGVPYALTNNSGYTVAPTPDDPAKWQATKRWTGCGPCGPRAVAVGKGLMAFAHRSGAYVFMGSDPTYISLELFAKTWRTINWDAQHLIWVAIDEEAKVIRFGVPTENSIAPNVILKVSYEESPDFAPPEHQMTLGDNSGALMASTLSRKWSMDDIAAYVCVRVERKIVSADSGGKTAGAGADALARQSQMMYGSSIPDGSVHADIPGVFNDNGAPINSFVETAGVGDGMRDIKVGGLRVHAIGYGDLQAYVVLGEIGDPLVNTLIPFAPMPLDVTKYPDDVGMSGVNCKKARLRLTNNNQAGSWFDLKYANLFTQTIGPKS